MGRTHKTKDADKQSADDANVEAKLAENRRKLAMNMLTAAYTMSAINRMSQNVDSRFDSLHVSLADLNQTVAVVEERISSNKQSERT